MPEETNTSKTIQVEKSQTTKSNEPILINTNGYGISFWKTLASGWLSRKLWMTIFSTLIVYGTYWHSINHLYSLTRPEQVSALSTMYIAMLSVLGVVVGAYLGTNAIQSKFNISSAAQMMGQTISEKRDDTITENSHKIEEITKNINLNEYIKEQGVNGPEMRPFGALASEE